MFWNIFHQDLLLLTWHQLKAKQLPVYRFNCIIFIKFITTSFMVFSTGLTWHCLLIHMCYWKKKKRKKLSSYHLGNLKPSFTCITILGIFCNLRICAQQTEAKFIEVHFHCSLAKLNWGYIAWHTMVSVLYFKPETIHRHKGLWINLLCGTFANTGDVSNFILNMSGQEAKNWSWPIKTPSKTYSWHMKN